jgi:hypothetical protein
MDLRQSSQFCRLQAPSQPKPITNTEAARHAPTQPQPLLVVVSFTRAEAMILLYRLFHITTLALHRLHALITCDAMTNASACLARQASSKSHRVMHLVRY